VLATAVGPMEDDNNSAGVIDVGTDDVGRGDLWRVKSSMRIWWTSRKALHPPQASIVRSDSYQDLPSFLSAFFCWHEIRVNRSQ
jgi:hypothetical protein